MTAGDASYIIEEKRVLSLASQCKDPRMKSYSNLLEHQSAGPQMGRKAEGGLRQGSKLDQKGEAIAVQWRLVKAGLTILAPALDSINWRVGKGSAAPAGI